MFWTTNLTIKDLEDSFYSYYFTEKFSHNSWIFSIHLNYAASTIDNHIL